MEREKLLQEQKAVLDSLVEKVRFIHSEEFSKLDDKEKQKLIANKVANENYAHSLSNTLWDEGKFQLNSITDLFWLSLISSMFSWGQSNGFPQYPAFPQSPVLSESVKSEENENKAE